MSEPRDFTDAIAEAVVSGDLKALAKISIELNALLAAARAREAAPAAEPARPRGTAKRSGYVYYVAADDRVKIAHSRNPWARLKAIQAVQPRATLLCTEVGDRELERARHSQFAASLSEGDWFDWTPELTALVSQLRVATTSPTVVATVVATGNQPAASDGVGAAPDDEGRVVAGSTTVATVATTVEKSPPPSPSLLSPTPPYNPSSPAPPRSTNRARETEESTGEVSEDQLRALVGDPAWPDVGRFLVARRADKRGAWRHEMAKLVGPGSQFVGEDLAKACSDALIVDDPLEGPHALRAFIAKAREERLTPPTTPKAGGRGGKAGEGDGNFAERRAAEDREKRNEASRTRRGREYDAARAAAVQAWATANPDQHAKIRDELIEVGGFKNPESWAFTASLAVKVASVIGFPDEDSWTGTWTPPVAHSSPSSEVGKRAITPDPYGPLPVGSSESDRRLAEEYEPALHAHVEEWRKDGNDAEYRDHERAVFSRFGYTRGQQLTDDQRAAVENAIALRIRDEKGWPLMPDWVVAEKRRRARRAPVPA